MLFRKFATTISKYNNQNDVQRENDSSTMIFDSKLLDKGVLTQHQAKLTVAWAQTVKGWRRKYRAVNKRHAARYILTPRYLTID